MKLGSSDVSALKLGGSDIAKVYIGSTEVIVAPEPLFMPNYIYKVDNVYSSGFMQKYGDSDYRMYKFDPVTGQRLNSDEALWLAYAQNPVQMGTDTMHQQWYFASGAYQPGTLLDYTAQGPNTGLPTSGWTNELSIQEYAGPTEVSVTGLSLPQYWVEFTGTGFNSYDPEGGSFDASQYLTHDGTSWLFKYFDDTVASLEQPFLSGPVGNYTNGVVVSAITP